MSQPKPGFLFNFKDFSLNTRVDFYPSLSEGGRLRVDYILNTKYDLPYDFYIKAEFQFNYDNQVVEGGSQFDYILNTGFGWSFDWAKKPIGLLHWK